MIKSDMLYQIHQRLQAIKGNNKPFGGVAVFFFGDLLQLRPTAAKYIFQEPDEAGFANSFCIEPLWHSFKIRNLTFNHRQGDDFEYSELLNRMRDGSLTEEDIELLQTRVMREDDAEIPKDALYLAATNAEINKVNEKKLEYLDQELITVKAVILGNTNSSRAPKLTAGGEIYGTPLQYILKLKVGARLMLTYNLDTFDGLTNGAQGQLVGFERGAGGQVLRLYVHFFDEKVGKERRKNCGKTAFLQQLCQSFPDKLPTPNKLEFSYSTSKKAYSTAVKNTALMFPVKLAWAITAHKIQGQTVKKPNKLIVNMQKVFEAAQAYVMLSRVENLNQLIIINDVCSKKIYSSELAVKELERLNNSCEDTLVVPPNLSIMSINIRSLQKHFEDLVKEPGFDNQDLIMVQQTCINRGEDLSRFQVESHSAHFNSRGNGKGVAVYYGDKFRHEADINELGYQMSMFCSTEFDVICVYRSTDNTSFGQLKFLEDLNDLINPSRRTIVIGDFNAVYPDNVISRELESWDFENIVTKPTHVEGNMIDHCYISNIPKEEIRITQAPVYYSNHDMLKVVM